MFSTVARGPMTTKLATTTVNLLSVYLCLFSFMEPVSAIIPVVNATSSGLES